MKLVMIGSGGMGVVSLSRMVAYMAIHRGLSVKSTEIHGMAKKGGLVEVYMKIGEGASPFIVQGEADSVIVMDNKYLDYAKAFLKNDGVLVQFSEEDKRFVVEKFGDLRFASSFVLGKFLKTQELFGMEDAKEVLKGFKSPKENLEALKRGVE